MSAYTGGRITRIKVINFMTYDELEIFPQSGLNLIVGLNGSGKSSIMAAICLGLAGKPQFTGRTLALGDFVKHNLKFAKIEIELECLGGANQTIRRTIRVDKETKDEWQINQKLSSLAEVTEVVKKFNIDTSNLCQFLPQEKVVEFSRMNKIQRLENLLQAIGEPHLFDLFNELKSMFKESVEIENKLKKSEQDKATAQDKNDRISGEVMQQQTRVQLKKKLDGLLKLKKVLEYNELRSELKKLKDEKKAMEKDYHNVLQQKRDALAKEEKIISDYKKLSENCERLKHESQERFRMLNNKSSTLSTLSGKVEEAKIEYKNKLAEKESQEKRLNDINKQIESLEEQLKEETARKQTLNEREAVINQALSQLQSEITNLHQMIEEASASRNSIMYSLKTVKSQLGRLKDERNKRLNILKSRDKYTFEAVMWVMDHRNEFRSNIFLPIMLEIQVNNSQCCKYIENHIGMRDMLAFLCEDKDDLKRLTEILKNQKKLPVNIVMAPSNPMSQFQSPPLPHEMRQWGLENFLIDLIEAPEPVLRFLCSCYQVHRVPVSTAGVDNSKIERIVNTFSLFFSGDRKVCGTKSRYGNRNWSIKEDFISNRNLLVSSDDEKFRQLQNQHMLLEQQLQVQNEEYDKINQALNIQESEQEKLRLEKRKLSEYERKYKSIQSNLTVKKSHRKNLSSTVIDEQEEKRKLNETIKDILAARVKVFSNFHKIFKDINLMHKKTAQDLLCLNILSKELKLTRAANEEVCEQVKIFEAELRNLQLVIDAKKGPAQLLLNYIKRLDIDVQQADLNNSMDALDDKINQAQAQLNLHEDNDHIVNEFQARQEQIAVILESIEKLKSRLKELNESLETKKQEWLAPLQYHVSNINGKFSRYFRHLNCAGEISLDIPENQNDFFNYGLQIRLKFREDQPFKELSSAHHSGGECSVTAIIFILSLQELTEVPFRCIDEINQGMDSIYERKIYQLISDSVSGRSRSQYFLLTPKLLFNLTYPENCAVHAIFNSSFLDTKVHVRNMLKIARAVQR